MESTLKFAVALLLALHLIGCNLGKKTEVIPPEGGSISLSDMAAAQFPSGAFENPTKVQMSFTEEDDFQEIYSEFAAIFLPRERSGSELRITTFRSPPLTDYISISLSPPDSFISSLPSGYGIQILFLVEQGTDKEGPYSIVELLPSEYDSANNILSAQLPTAAFTSTSYTDYQYEAVLVLIQTPGENESAVNTESARAISSTSVNNCQAADISCPVEGGCSVTSPYNLARKHPVTGGIKPHYAVDYQAARGTPIVAAAAGTVERSYTSPSYGETVVIRHNDGSATLYAHLETRNVMKGDSVSNCATIGTADSTGMSAGDHLHFEYVPNGQIIQSRNRIDPDSCVVPCSNEVVGMVGCVGYPDLFYTIEGVVLEEGNILFTGSVQDPIGVEVNWELAGTLQDNYLSFDFMNGVPEWGNSRTDHCEGEWDGSSFSDEECELIELSADDGCPALWFKFSNKLPSASALRNLESVDGTLIEKIF